MAIIQVEEDLRHRFETVFVLLVIICAGFIHYIVPYKMAFINLYAIPVLLAAYYLDIRKTLLGAVACILLTCINVRLDPKRFLVDPNSTGLYLNLFTWSCLLLLSAILVEGMKRQLISEMAHGEDLDRQLAEFKKFDEIKDRLMRSVAHDLKAPLHAILAYASVMLRGRALDETQQRQLDIICSSTKKLASFIDEVLDLSKLQAGHMQFDKTAASLPDILKSVYDLQKASADKFGITLDLKMEDSLPPVLADKNQIARVVTNLVFNAFKFTPEKGTVAISAAKEGALKVVVRIHDSGVGIPKEMLDRVFDKFVQVTETRMQARAAGTGLGLTISKEIIESHGGKIWADSGGVDTTGSTFSFTLPVADGKAS